MSKTIKVSIWMITFNHEKFIQKALDSILMQKCDFELEVIVGDDLSSDNTREVINKYVQKYPEIIKPIYRERNVGIAKNFEETWFQCKGKYIALLEGDDYWTDPFKLQKQVDFLEQNNDFIACYTKAKEIDEITNHTKITNEDDNETTGLKEILSQGWFMRTASLVVRNNLFQCFPDFFYRYGSTDYILHILIAQKGPIKFIDELTCVYRRHEGGITQSFSAKQIDFNHSKIALLREIDSYFGYKFKDEIGRLIKRQYNSTAVQYFRRRNIVKAIWYFAKGSPVEYYKIRKKATK